MPSDWAKRQRAIQPAEGGRVHASTHGAGTRVLIDGERRAIVRCAFPRGSTSYLFPHCKVDVIGGEKNVAVALDRLTKFVGRFPPLVPRS